MALDEFRDVKQIFGTVRDRLENDQVFGGGQSQFNVADLMDAAARDDLLLERQHPQRHIHADATLLVPQQGHPIGARTLRTGNARNEAQFGGHLEQIRHATHGEQEDDINVRGQRGVPSMLAATPPMITPCVAEAFQQALDGDQG